MKLICFVLNLLVLAMGILPTCSSAASIEAGVWSSEHVAIFQEASQERSSQVCMKLIDIPDGEAFFYKCVVHVVYLTKDAAHCGKLNNKKFEYSKAVCLGLAADINNDEKICNEISSQKELFEDCQNRFRQCNGDTWKDWRTHIRSFVHIKRVFKTEQRQKDCANRLKPKESTHGKKQKS